MTSLNASTEVGFDGASPCVIDPDIEAADCVIVTAECFGVIIASVVSSNETVCKSLDGVSAVTVVDFELVWSMA